MLHHPIPGARISQAFSWDHPGVDFASPIQGEYSSFFGSPVRAAFGGVVQVPATHADSYGNWVRVQRSSGWEPSTSDHERYAHLDRILVVGGQRIETGEVIGTVGYSGHTEPPGLPGTHLHFEVWRGAERIDPIPWLRQGGAFVTETGDPIVDMMLRWPAAEIQAQKNLYWMEVMRRKREMSELLAAEADKMERNFVDPNGPMVWQLYLLGLPTPDGFETQEAE